MNFQRSWIALGAIAALAACAQEGALAPEPSELDALAKSSVARGNYEIVLENLTPDRGDGGAQVFSPPVLATHNPSVGMFRVGDIASPGLAMIAEDAVNGPMVNRLRGERAVHQVLEGGGVVPPGASARYEMEAVAGGQWLSMVFMLVNTNDAFAGVDRLRLPRDGELSVELYAYDAGSEANTELFGDIPGPCCGSPGVRVPTSEPIAMHPGIEGHGDLDPAKWGWDGAVARLTIRRLD